MTLEKYDVTALLDLLQIKTSCVKTLTLDMRDILTLGGVLLYKDLSAISQLNHTLSNVKNCKKHLQQDYDRPFPRITLGFLECEPWHTSL